MGTSGSNPGIESSVGTFLDGLYMPTSAMSINELADVQNIEILRGPQGTLYGRNTPVGAINITTRKPGQESEAMLRLGAGNFSQVTASGYVGGGLSDDVAGRVSFYYRDRDGYLENLARTEPANDTSEKGVRGKLLFTPSDNVEINFTAYLSDVKRHCCVADHIDPLGPNGIATPAFLALMESQGAPFLNFSDDDHVVQAVDNGNDETDSWGTSLQVDWSLADEFLLTSITGYQSWENTVQL